MVPITSLFLARRLIARFGAATVAIGGLVIFAAGVIVWAVLWRLVWRWRRKLIEVGLVLPAPEARVARVLVRKFRQA